MEFFPGVQSAQVSYEMMGWIEEGFEREGFGLWAIELPGELPLVGFVGLVRVRPGMPFAPAVEIGWRLTPTAWGRGIAFEAAQAALDHGFGAAGLAEIVAYTAAGNLRSRRLMERLGMRRDVAGDFDHPQTPPGHPLAAHVLYRLRSEDWPGSRQA